MEELRRVFIWSGWLRISHWAMALSTLVLVGTGWLIANTPLVVTAAVDVHYLAASVLILGLLLRIVAMFKGGEHERLSGLLPDDRGVKQIKAVLLFYLSLGKMPLRAGTPITRYGSCCMCCFM